MLVNAELDWTYESIWRHLSRLASDDGQRKGTRGRSHASSYRAGSQIVHDRFDRTYDMASSQRCLKPRLKMLQQVQSAGCRNVLCSCVVLESVGVCSLGSSSETDRAAWAASMVTRVSHVNANICMELLANPGPSRVKGKSEHFWRRS